MRSAINTLLIVNRLLLLTLCLPALWLLNMFNPMQIALLTEFTIENRCDQPIHVTPVGTAGKEAQKMLLPVFVSRVPAIMAVHRGDFRIAPGSSKRILYDWDDVNLSEIVVRDSAGEMHQLVVDPTPTLNRYHAPSTDRFVIGDLSSLSPPAPAVLQVVRKGTSCWLFCVVMGLCTIPLVTYILLIAIRKRFVPACLTDLEP